MRWRAVSSGSIYGVNYSADAAVNTEPWTASQIQEQVYLGKIYPDYTQGTSRSFLGTNAKWNGVYADRKWSQSAVGNFVGPPSGRALFMHSAWARSYSSSGAVTIKCVIHTGSTLRKGTEVQVSASMIFRGTSITTNAMTFAVNRLTPGASYNVFQTVSNSVAGAEVRYPRIQIVPLPD